MPEKDLVRPNTQYAKSTMMSCYIWAHFALWELLCLFWPTILCTAAIISHQLSRREWTDQSEKPVPTTEAATRDEVICPNCMHAACNSPYWVGHPQYMLKVKNRSMMWFGTQRVFSLCGFKQEVDSQTVEHRSNIQRTPPAGIRPVNPSKHPRLSDQLHPLWYKNMRNSNESDSHVWR